MAKRKILKGEGHNFPIFRRIFFDRTNVNLIAKQESSKVVRGHASPENLENLHAVITIFGAF